MTMTRAEIKAKSYRKNREKNLAYAASYREANRQRIKEQAAGKNAVYSATYREKNPRKCAAMSQAWKDANPEKRRVTKSAWQRANSERHRAHQHNRRARVSGDKLSFDIAARLYELQEGRCACCGGSLAEGFHIDHIVPLARGGRNIDSNVQLLKPTCNLRKGARMVA